MEAVAERPITADEFMEMRDPNDGLVRELIRGEIVTMSLPGGLHGVVCSKIDRKVGNHSDSNRLGHVASNDTGILLERDPDTLRGADVSYWSFARLPKMPKGYVEIAPDLAIEVFSPNDTQRKIRQKIKEFFFNGTKRVWVVYPEDRMVAVFRSPTEAKFLDEIDELDGEDVLPGFRCKVADFFPPAE